MNKRRSKNSEESREYRSTSNGDDRMVAGTWTLTESDAAGGATAVDAGRRFSPFGPVTGRSASSVQAATVRKAQRIAREMFDEMCNMTNLDSAGRQMLSQQARPAMSSFTERLRAPRSAQCPPRLPAPSGYDSRARLQIAYYRPPNSADMPTRAHLTIALTFCVAAPLAAQTAIPALKVFDPSYIDKSANACQDFFAFANGAWIKRDTIPAAFSSSGVSKDMTDRNELVVRSVLDEAMASRHSKSASSDRCKAWNLLRQLHGFFAGGERRHCSDS